MTAEKELRELARDLDEMANAVALDDNIRAADLRKVLRFLTKVLQVVDQSLQEVYAVLIELQFLSAEDVQAGRVPELKRDLEGVFSRSRFRDAEEICSRLHHLEEEFGRTIRPIVQHLQGNDQWAQVFYLLNEHEGRVIQMIHEAVYELREMLDGDLTGRKLSSLRQKAKRKTSVLRDALLQLQNLRNRILGLSGRTGFLELTSTDRDELKREVKIMVDKSDRSITHGHRVTLGDGTVVHHSFVVAEHIQNSFNAASNADASQELKDTLQELCTAVAQMTEHLSDEQAAEVSRDLETLVKEAASDAPRKKWYELSADGLVSAANAVGKVAKPVIDTTKAILVLLAAAT